MRQRLAALLALCAIPAMAVEGSMTKQAAEGHGIAGPGYRVHAGQDGALAVSVAEEHYQIATRLSYPGERIGWNVLGARDTTTESVWRPTVRRTGSRTVECRAVGAHYALKRTVTVAGRRVVVRDTVTNTGAEDVAIQYHQELSAPLPARVLLGGSERPRARLMAENPSVFVSAGASRLGWLAEDAVLRLQLESAVIPGVVRMSADRFALRPGASHTFQWVLYPLAAPLDYWTFVNQIRRDWRVNFTVQGPFDYFDLTKNVDLLRDPSRLRAYLQRKKLKVIAFQPWVDYENYDARTGHPMTRPELRELAREATAAIKRVDPSILCVGCIEGNLVSLPPDAQRALWDSAPNRPQEQYPLTDEQMALLKRYDLPWKDCLLQSADGRSRYELYYRGDGAKRIPMIAIAVYAAPGNGQHRYWLNQARFLLEDVRMDGLYIDQFNMAFADAQRYSYDKWDGTTVDADPTTGRIVRRYTDAGLVGIGARRSLADYVMGHSRYMLANTFPATAEMQSVRVHRFNESEWGVDVLAWRPGEKPPLVDYPCQGHFSTPISLGVRPFRYGDEGLRRYGEVVMRAAITYLRHGLLYYHYGSDIPEAQSGVYDAIAHMFPLTPVELREGAVIGKERTVTCVSGDYAWRPARKPTVLVYNLQGNRVEPQVRVARSGAGWRVDLQIRDWAEMAVIE